MPCAIGSLVFRNARGGLCPASFCSALLSILLAFAGAAGQTATNAGQRLAMLYATGTVLVNGTAVVRPTALFAGDRIVTAPNSGVVLVSGGKIVSVPANSTLVVTEATMQSTR